VDPKSCANNCNGRGSCRQGFCHCEKGYFGRDCSRSKAYHPPLLGPDHPVPYGQLKIYVYELPWHVAFNIFPNTRGHFHDQIYVGPRSCCPSLAARLLLSCRGARTSKDLANSAQVLARVRKPD
jgi:hypothetical protein